MISNLNQTPSANRIHIGFFGKRNSGKSSLVNAFAGQEVSIVSDVKGTTTDPVSKAMEIHGIGPVQLIDTAGYDDTGKLGKSRVLSTQNITKRTDVAIMVFDEDVDSIDLQIMENFKLSDTPVITVLTKSDQYKMEQSIIDLTRLSESIYQKTGIRPIQTSAVDKRGIKELKEAIIEAVKNNKDEEVSITGNLVKEGDTVLLVMPQDIQAPKGRLILPQVQTLRELLDKKCVVTCVTLDKLDDALSAVAEAPDLIITDSQAFKEVFKKKPGESKLTSFSILFAGYKGDIEYYLEGVKKLDDLTENSKVLIAECCTHAPLNEDIGRVKIPNLLRKKYGEKIEIDVVSGKDFAKDLKKYDIIIQCGACMFNRKHVMSRINQAKDEEVPMTNYGVVLAYFAGILDDVAI